MATETQDPRAQLAKMEAEEKAAREKADKIAEDNAKKKTELLASLRDADLADVKEKCLMHGFTATELRTVLKTKGGAKKGAARKSAPRKTAARKTTGSKRATKST